MQGRYKSFSLGVLRSASSILFTSSLGDEDVGKDNKTSIFSLFSTSEGFIEVWSFKSRGDRM